MLYLASAPLTLIMIGNLCHCYTVVDITHANTFNGIKIATFGQKSYRIMLYLSMMIMINQSIKCNQINDTHT